MSATYNWAYKPGVGNKYNFNVPSGPDSLPVNYFTYVALFGNDITGNGSRQYPYKTISKGLSALAGLGGGTIFVASGVYRDLITEQPTSNNIVGDGDVIMDSGVGGSFFNGPVGGYNYYNITFRGNVGLSCQGITDCRLYNVTPGGTAPKYSPNSIIQNSVMSNNGVRFYGADGNQAKKNLTFYNFMVNITSTGSQAYSHINSIFYNCNIYFDSKPIYLDYCLFYNCNFMLGGGGGTGPDTTDIANYAFYPLSPPGYTYYSTIADLQAASITAFGPGGVNFDHCIMGDPMFNNAAINDFSLAFSSPAKNASYFGTPIGASSVGYGLKARAIESQGSFDFSSNVNLNIADDSITIVDTTQLSSIETKVIVNTIGREISYLPTFGFNADRNGQYIDSIPDLSPTIIDSTQSLTAPTPYLVQTGAIVYNSNTYQPGDRFTTVTGTTGFTTSASGVVIEIIEAPERHTVMARFSDGYGLVLSGTPLTSGYWYYVDSGSATYSGVTYTGSTVFKAQDTSSFSGNGVVILAITGETYQHYEIGSKPYSNNTGDSRTGSILRGNGDPAYVRGGINVTEFPINSKFIQLKYILQYANLTP